MTTRRDFCKNLLAAGIASASLHAFAKSYCGMDFGKVGDCGETVWSEIIHGCYLKSWNDLLAQVRPEDLVGGRASPKSLYLSAHNPYEKSKKEKLEEEYRRIWFEEASEFENWNWKGKKDA